MHTFIKLLPQSFRAGYRGKWYSVNLQSKIIFAKISRRFHRPKYPTNYPKEIRLHLGCGNINYPGFVNIDSLPFPHVHYVRSINDLAPFKDESVDSIYACHCLEHFPHNQISSILSQWYQKLKPNGTLRISVPNFDQLVEIYLDNNRDLDLILSPLMGGQINYFDFHKAAFNSKNLNLLLRDVGFKVVGEWSKNVFQEDDLNDWSKRQFLINGKNYFVSLNLEAIK